MFTHVIKFVVGLCLAWFISIYPVFADQDKLRLIWEVDGLSDPESVVYDPRLNLLYVSNINGAPSEKDNNGYISIVSMSGRLLQKKWMQGLHAPKGLAIFDRTLYVADIDRLVAISIDKGHIIKSYKAKGAEFLNDVTVDNEGSVYVSDMVLNRIYRLHNDQFDIWIESPELENPNGLHFNGDDIIVGSWGKMTDGFATDIPGHLKRIAIKTASVSSIGDGAPVGNLDGVEGNDEVGFYVTDWMNGKLFHITTNGEVTTLLELNHGSADHEYIAKKGLIIIPMMTDGALLAYKLN